MTKAKRVSGYKETRREGLEPARNSSQWSADHKVK